jgi:hypothetical protein
MKRRIKAFKTDKNFVSIINENNILIFMVFCFLLGNLISILVFKLNNTQNNFYETEFKEYISDFDGNFGKVFTASALQIAPYMCLIFLAGTSMAGSIITPLIIALRGAKLGFISSYLYVHFSLNGIIFNILLIIPSAVLTALSLIFSGREAFGFSLSLARLAVPDSKSVILDNDFKIYCMRQLFILLFYILGILLQTIMVISFYSFFKLNV